MTKVRKTNTCWLWTANCNPNGYGMLTIDGKLFAAHRVSYQYFKGPIPKGLCVLHQCDNPPCVNPAHLFLGTHKTNAEDRGAKNRNNFQRGEATGHAKLTADQVMEIRSMNNTHAFIAERFGVSRSLVGAIKNKKVWAHL